MTGDATQSSSRRVLVLGGTGMLGHSCVEYLQRDGRFSVESTDRHAAPDDRRIDVRQNSRELRSLLGRRRYDLIINAIGVLRASMTADRVESLKDAILVNSVFPHDLAVHAAAAGTRVVHVSTDAVFSGRSGAPYDEAAPPAPGDPYGASKWLGEPRSLAVLTVRCSIIGRHPERPGGLIGWFRALPPGARVPGFTDYRWTPATTHQVARLMGQLAERSLFDRLRGLSPVLHFAPNTPLTKWEMIDMLNGFRRGDVHVESAEHPTGPIDLSLTTRFEAFRALSAEPRPWAAVLSDLWQ